MSAGNYTITILQGSTFNLELQYTDSEGDAINLTDYHAQMQIRPDFADNTDIIFSTLSSSLDEDGSGIIINPTEGTLLINISAEQTEVFNFDEALYDLELYSGSFVTRILEGKVRSRREVTR
jgi:hypothetical protein